MSSIMRARSGLTGRFEDWEVIGGSSLKPKVAGPSMLGIGCPNRHAFLFTRSPTPPENPPTSTPPSRESGFVRCPFADVSTGSIPPIDRDSWCSLYVLSWGRAGTPLDKYVQVLRISLREECAIWTL